MRHLIAILSALPFVLAASALFGCALLVEVVHRASHDDTSPTAPKPVATKRRPCSGAVRETRVSRWLARTPEA